MSTGQRSQRPSGRRPTSMGLAGSLSVVTAALGMGCILEANPSFLEGSSGTVGASTRPEAASTTVAPAGSTFASGAAASTAGPDEASAPPMPSTGTTAGLEPATGTAEATGAPVERPIPFVAFTFDDRVGTTEPDAAGSAAFGELLAVERIDDGAYGRAIAFEAYSDDSYLSILPPNLFDELSRGTIAFWFRCDDCELDPPGTWLSMLDVTSLSCDDALGVGYRDQMLWVWIGSCSEAVLLIRLERPTLGEWHHFAFTASPDGNRVYLDGVRQTPRYDQGSANTTVFFESAAAGETVARLGAGIDAADAFAGALDEFRVYATALSDAQVELDMRSPDPLAGG